MLRMAGFFLGKYRQISDLQAAVAAPVAGMDPGP